MNEAFREWHVLDDVDVVVARDVFGVVHNGVECVLGAKDDGAVCCGLVVVGSQRYADTLCVRKRLDDLQQSWLVHFDVFDDETREERKALGIQNWGRSVARPCGWRGKEGCAGLWRRCEDRYGSGHRHGENTDVVCGGELMVCGRWRGRGRRG